MDKTDDILDWAGGVLRSGNEVVESAEILLNHLVLTDRYKDLPAHILDRLRKALDNYDYYAHREYRERADSTAGSGDSGK